MMGEGTTYRISQYVLLHEQQINATQAAMVLKGKSLGNEIMTQMRFKKMNQDLDHVDEIVTKTEYQR